MTPVTVTSTADVDPSPPGLETLRSAINSNATSIDFAPGLSGTTIYLGKQLILNVRVTINNTTANVITLMGNGTFRLIQTKAGTTDEIDNLEMDQGGGVLQGGGIYNAGTLTLSGCYMRLNSTTGAGNTGGAIANAAGATLTLNHTQLYENTADYGGAISSSGTVTINSGTVIESNNANRDGGGIWNGSIDGGGQLTITDHVVVNDNSAGEYGGGIFNGGDLTMGASSLTYNHAQVKGGGLYSSNGDAILTGTDIEQNQATNATAEGGGFFLLSGTLTLKNGTLRNNIAPTGAGGAWVTGWTDGGGNTITDGVVKVAS